MRRVGGHTSSLESSRHASLMSNTGYLGRGDARYPSPRAVVKWTNTKSTHQHKVGQITQFEAYLVILKDLATKKVC